MATQGERLEETQLKKNEILRARRRFERCPKLLDAHSVYLAIVFCTAFQSYERRSTLCG